MKVVVCGPSHSGKSTFTAGLIRLLRARAWERVFNRSFTWLTLDVTDNTLPTLVDPDGKHRRKRDVEWSTERAQERRAGFEHRDESLVLADAPGRITDELRLVTEPADCMILLCSLEKRDERQSWLGFAEETGIELYADMTTVLRERIEPGWNDRSDRNGTVRSVSRSAFDTCQTTAFDDTSHRMLKQLATDLLNDSQ
ncbi:hypothetical protein BRC71_05885 [Halobacteriales archaeon QH_7_65_31]|nr:MAG: hypothetical protein BRC71_05885 [Halobacteriales archaeon QH_7_65_31]